MEQKNTAAFLQVYPVPAEAPNRESAFSVTVCGQPLGLMTERNEWKKMISFGVFDLDEGHEVRVEIQVHIPFTRASLYPASEGIIPEVQGNTVTYTVSRPVNALSLVLDENYQGEVLHLFSNPVDHDAPTASSENLIYIAPGYHDLTRDGGTGELVLHSGETLYLAGGAVLDGTVTVQEAENVTIRGSGILMISEEEASRSKAQSICLVTIRSSHIHVENVVCHAHRFHNWTVHFWYSEHITVQHVKICSPVYASTDGIDISNTSHVSVKDSFIRACDDCIALKGLASETQKPAECPPIEDILFEDCVLWNDCNNAMGLGAETRAACYRDITFRNIDVIYSYDDRDHHEKLNERSVMNICCLHGTFFENILWENIHVNRCERLICMTFQNSFWFGSLPGDQSFPGGMRDIAFRGITADQNSGSAISGEILLHGMEGKIIRDVTLENIHVFGEKLTQNAQLHRNAFTEEIAVF